MPGDDLDLITAAVLRAGELARGYVGAEARRWNKPDDAGPVTEADIAVNDLLEEALRSARPDYGWLSEESEDTGDRRDREFVFVIDPIDGTRSFAEGSNTWAHSVAVCRDGAATAGAIYLPLRDKLFTAALGSGAYLNGARIEASTVEDPNAASVLATKPSIAPERWPRGVPGFRREHRPSLAYRLGLVAQGRFEAMVTFRPTWEWDVAAGALIVTEAGGVCTDAAGKALRFNQAVPRHGGVVAAGPNIHAPLLEAMRA
ncbi:3'(2'),5'-bisphosphate nucleotidase CysQ [Sulfitobacter sp. D35]|uniref:inositol monophosphatase family protein n=1 Tax=Sulfitobacter sp. D35 TaxID=3083252 RepID=UPI00296F6559|nr:3'(2'),5'-bisphosphate nucleotidase CysQ [Sulfitobacter sp. D35]MDW4498327.1 3'(2'),5'-bisphosphate nucleotidase CysQ [Sulfitobacter sp. D35]